MVISIPIYIMVASSILPVALHKGELYFLFGKECPLEESAKGFSDFGGRIEEGENPYTGALREGAEELGGFLGNESKLRKMIKGNGGVYHMKQKTYHLHLFVMEYDEGLPIYYNNHNKYIWDTVPMDVMKKLYSEHHLFEKSEIEWFTPNMMTERKKEFRNFYQSTVDAIIKDVSKIRKFVKSKVKGGNNATKKSRS